MFFLAKVLNFSGRTFPAELFRHQLRTVDKNDMSLILSQIFVSFTVDFLKNIKDSLFGATRVCYIKNGMTDHANYTHIDTHIFI